MQIRALVIVAVASTYVVPHYVTAEVIEIHSCNVGETLLENGDSWTCIGNEPTGGGDGGDLGGGGNDPMDGWDGFDVQEQVRKWRCAQCKSNTDNCIKQAQLAEGSCIANAYTMANWRCDIESHELEGTHPMTVWGCDYYQLQHNVCGNVDTGNGGIWTDPRSWEYSCSRRQPGNHLVCTGYAEQSCIGSWQQSHLGGSTTVTDSQVLTVNFEKVGTSSGKTITATYQLTAERGFSQSCAIAGNSLVTGCTATQTACYASFSCTSADF